ncbi:hypothetical protein ACCD10_00090 [Pseudomonas sp. Pseusp122]|uniref:hypothetical protein n=1 Tax=unclassified Pseudomonas TaxID=196821 RepID=UPI0039A473A3
MCEDMRIGHVLDRVDHLEEFTAMSPSPAPEVQKVEGRITFVGSKPMLDGIHGLSAMRLVTFSYSVEGQHFHKILDSRNSAHLRQIANDYSVGDRLEVWCLKSDPNVCGIGEIPVHKSSAWDWVCGLAECLQILS